jgi:uncharacterized protein (TIGR02217 family)
MAIDPQQLSARVEKGARGGPTWDTTILMGTSGIEQRNANWSRPIYKFTIGYGIKLIGDAATNVINMFNACQGQLHGFLFKDWSDYTATAQPLTALSGTTFQMYRSYPNGTRTVTRKITRPVSGSVTVNAGSISSIDYTTGIITMSSGTPTTWSGQFYVPVRFEDDHLDISTTLDGIVSIPSVNLIEVLE